MTASVHSPDAALRVADFPGGVRLPQRIRFHVERVPSWPHRRSESPARLGRALRVARESLLALWAIGALAFWVAVFWGAVS